MKKFKKVIVAIALAIIAVSAFIYYMVGMAPAVPQKTVVATIGNEKITKDDFDKEISKYDDQLRKQLGDDYATNDKIKEQLLQAKQKRLEDMIIGKIMLIKATELNIKPSDDDMNKQIDHQIRQVKARYPQEGQFESVLEKSGMTEDKLKESMKTQIITNLMNDYMVKDVIITNDDVLTYYNENKASEFSEGNKITPLDQVKDRIKASLLQQKQMETHNSKLEEWKIDLKVKTYEDKL